MNVHEMIVIIVAMMCMTAIVTAAIHAKAARVRARVAHEPDRSAAREEMQALKARIAVLERIATERNRPIELEFEQLRGG